MSGLPPMIMPKSPRDMLRRIGAAPGDRFDVAEAALALAALDEPNGGSGTTIDPYREHLDAVAGDVSDAGGGDHSLEGRCAALVAAIHERHGYDGDTATYDDLQNANFMRVIDRRKGLPVALGILYIHAARRQGWTIAGLNFPGHFLLQMDGAGGRVIIDPFHHGRRLEAGEMRALLKTMQGAAAELTPEHYRTITDREILLRLQNNVKLRLMQMDQVGRAAAIVDGMLLFAPDVPALWREAGLMHAHAGNLGHAVTALETYLTHETRETARREVAAYLQRLRQRLN
jgi:regulator of sirC expression with transglutaminase-like and TPR domain